MSYQYDRRYCHNATLRLYKFLKLNLGTRPLPTIRLLTIRPQTCQSHEYQVYGRVWIHRSISICQILIISSSFSRPVEVLTGSRFFPGVEIAAPRLCQCQCHARHNQQQPITAVLHPFRQCQSASLVAFNRGSRKCG